LAHAWQSGPEQHIFAHMAPPMDCCKQPWKHDMAVAHVVLFRQFWVWLQHWSTMHWLHGVPPGSIEQVPASTGTPQWPLSHARPMQHCCEVVQFEPGGRQVSAPQTPF